MKKEYVVLLAVAILAVSVIASAFIIGGKDTYIRSLGDGSGRSGQLAHTISVTGKGAVYAKPDKVSLQVTVSETAATVQAAQDAMTTKVKSVKDILSNKKIADKDVSTSEYSIQPEYDYANRATRLIGHRARQTLQISIKDIDEKASKAIEIIDEVTKIANIQVNNVTFDIEDKTKIFTQARELAYQKAEQKAKELADISDVTLLKPLAISDTSLDYTPRQYNNVQANNMQYEALKESADSSGDLPTGQLQVTVNLSVEFGIE